MIKNIHALPRLYKSSFSMATLSGLSALYLVIPIFVYMGIGEDFYIYSSSQSLVNYISVLCFFALNIFILFLLKIAAKPPKFILFVKMSASTVIIYVNYVLMLLILVVGIKLRASGAGRPELLESISNPIVPGFGFILLLSCISCVLNKRKIYLIIFIILSLLVDAAYNGKIFTFLSLVVLMFYLDFHGIKFSLNKILFIVLFGFLFMITTFFMRAMTADGGGDEGVVTLYSLFYEFSGVNASIGWASDYRSLGFPSVLWNFDIVLADFYTKYVGYGLALSFPAYFLGNFGSYWGVSVFIYLSILALISIISVRFIGYWFIFVVMYNFQHLMRHGPDVFIIRLIFQMFAFFVLEVFVRSIIFVRPTILVK